MIDNETLLASEDICNAAHLPHVKGAETLRMAEIAKRVRMMRASLIETIMYARSRPGHGCKTRLRAVFLIHKCLTWVGTRWAHCLHLRSLDA